MRRLEGLGYRWAYRVIDSQAFGIPQRRERVYLLASLETDPAPLLFAQDTNPRKHETHANFACGFYWTEGNTGLGWAINAIPTLKTGSALGIASPPAIWMPDGRIVTPDIRDAERLQGFEPDWTVPAEKAVSERYRWGLIGNAVTVDVAEWIGRCISDVLPPKLRASLCFPLNKSDAWPRAAFGSAAGRYGVKISSWPVRRALPSARFRSPGTMSTLLTSVS